MTWAKLDDAFPEHPRIDALSDGAFRLHVSGICWSNRWLTDGYIPDERVSRLLPKFKVAYLTELIDAHRWAKADDGGWLIVGFLDWNRSAEQVRADREASAERMRKGRKKEPAPDVRPNTQRTQPERSAPVRQSKTLTLTSTGNKSSSSPPLFGAEEEVAPGGLAGVVAMAALVHAERAFAGRNGEQVWDAEKWKATAAKTWRQDNAQRIASVLAPGMTAEELLRKIDGGTSRPGYVIAAAVEHPVIDEDEKRKGRVTIAATRARLPTNREAESA